MKLMKTTNAAKQRWNLLTRSEKTDLLQIAAAMGNTTARTTTAMAIKLNEMAIHVEVRAVISFD